jgi:signal transduction histidine kinase
VRDSQKEVTGLITVAIDVTERLQLQREILEISDREQARIGQDIHDGLCQQLIGLAICANGLEQSLSGQGMSEAETASKICKLLDEAITEARGVCQGLYPIRLRTEGLPPALRELATSVAERHGIRCVAELQDDNLRCDRAIATHLYRIAQEAVNNAAKHSGARQITIRLARARGEIMLEIRDDGRWRAGAPSRNSGMGMHIMDYRAQLIGGILQCQGGENGTLISCRVPHSGAAFKEGDSGTISDHAALS